MVSVKEIKRFHRKKKSIPGIVRKQVRKNDSILTGGHALNSHLPAFLDRPTSDFDIFSNNPKKSARELERRLDKKFEGNLFFTQPAIFPGTTKVINRVTESEVADFSKKPNNLSSVKKGNIRVASIPFLQSKFRQSLRDPESKFRHAKDRDALRRLRVSGTLR